MTSIVQGASPLSSTSSQSSLIRTTHRLDNAADTVTGGTNNMEEISLTSETPKLGNSPPTPNRTIPRLDTRTASVANPLPWKIDETSSPYTPTSQARKTYAPPPRSTYANNSASLDIAAHARPSSPSYYTTYAPSTPYTPIDLSHPPGYSQDSHSSFSDCSYPTYSNSTPFYQNSYSSSTFSSGLASPMTPTQRGRGILDNDPSIYLRGEGGGENEDETMWDTAAKWAKAAGKRLSQGEQTIWRMVNAIANGDEER